jgi:hypothetical protein
VWPEAAGHPASFRTQKAAVALAEKEIGSNWNVRPKGARYSKSQPQEPKPATKAEQKAQQAKQSAKMAIEG